ncbi:MAG: VPLPA-CTERM sorting domain-containing protein [Pseudomonadota bacterium]
MSKISTAKGGVRMRKSLMTFVLSILFFSIPAHAASFNITSFDNGWYRNDGSHGPTNTNVFTGRSGSSELRSFFAFDLSQLTGLNVLSVTISFRGANGRYRSSDPSETLGLFDVTTPINPLVSGAGGISAFNDLGSGISYGSYVYTDSNESNMDPFSVALNGSAISFLNSVLSGADKRFAIGGAILSLDGSNTQSIWSSSGGVGAATLTVETGVAPVPLPAAAWFFLTTLLGAGWFRRRQVKASA